MEIILDLIYFVGGVCCGGVGGAGGLWLSGGNVLSRNSSRSAAFWMVKMRGDRIPRTIARLRGCAFSGESLNYPKFFH
jgi:hypothetical protein